MNREDVEDLIQYKALKKLTGRKASSRQLEIDFMRELFGSYRSKNHNDAFKHRSSFQYDVEDKTENRFEKFIESIDHLSLAQRIIGVMLFCGLSLKDIKRITGLKHCVEFYRLLRG